MLYSRLSIIGICLLLGSFNALAQTTTTTTVVEKHIVTPAPKGTCTTVAAHFEGDVWQDSYTICKYENRQEGVAWVSEYWSCTASTSDGTCTTWALVPGHWISTLQ